jgi:inner membrane protease ATP23
MTNESSKCQTYLERYVKSSPMIKFLFEALEKRNCPIPKITCTSCPSDMLATGIYRNDTNDIVLCSNWINNGLQVEDTIAHELIHAFDNCRVKFDEKSCIHHACSEIRAANLSGDCRLSREIFRGQVGLDKIAGHHQKCVKRRAILSLKSNSACNSCDIEKIVNEIFPTCFSDIEPFLDIP